MEVFLNLEREGRLDVVLGVAIFLDELPYIELKATRVRCEWPCSLYRWFTRKCSDDALTVTTRAHSRCVDSHRAEYGSLSVTDWTFLPSVHGLKIGEFAQSWKWCQLFGNSERVTQYVRLWFMVIRGGYQRRYDPRLMTVAGERVSPFLPPYSAIRNNTPMVSVSREKSSIGKVTVVNSWLTLL